MKLENDPYLRNDFVTSGAQRFTRGVRWFAGLGAASAGAGAIYEELKHNPQAVEALGIGGITGVTIFLISLVVEGIGSSRVNRQMRAESERRLIKVGDERIDIQSRRIDAQLRRRGLTQEQRTHLRFRRSNLDRRKAQSDTRSGGKDIKDK